MLDFSLMENDCKFLDGSLVRGTIVLSPSSSDGPFLVKIIEGRGPDPRFGKNLCNSRVSTFYQSTKLYLGVCISYFVFQNFEKLFPFVIGCLHQRCNRGK